MFRINAYTLGYTHDIRVVRGLETGIGGNFTLYSIPSTLTQFYGNRPAGFFVFLRVSPEPRR